MAALLQRDLYEHQKTAIEAGLQGRDGVISADTASGKSLCYQALVAQMLATAAGARWTSPR